MSGQNVQITPAASKEEIEQTLIRANPDKIAVANVILKRTVKSLRKKLSRARKSFHRIMAETKDLPEWFYESEIETLSESELYKHAQFAYGDMTVR